MKTTLLAIALFLSFSTYSQNWVQKAPLPSHIGIGAPVYFTINDKLYVGGGYTGNKSVNTFYEYNSLSDTWSQKANIPDSIYSGCYFSLNGKGYVVCGADPRLTNKVYAYDPITDSWQTKNNFPGAARQNLSGFSLKGKGYLGGGFIGGSSCSNEMWQYNDTTDSWRQMASIPGPGRNGIFPIIINDLAYVGLGANSSATIWYADLYSFNPDSNTYTPVDSFPTPVGGAVFFTIGQTGYIGLGHTGFSTPSNIYKYSATANQWTLADTFNGGSRFVSFCGVIGGKPYIGCGSDSAGTYYYDNWTWECTSLTITQHGDTLFSSAASNYQWYFNGVIDSGATSSFYIASASGNYSVQTTDSNLCINSSNPYKYTTTAIHDIHEMPTVSIYPNPTNDFLILNAANQFIGSEYNITDLTGRAITTGKINNTTTRIDVRHLSLGIYIIQVDQQSYKVIKQ